MTILEKQIAGLIHEYENPRRIAISRRYPRLKKPVIFLRRTIRNAKNFLNPKIKTKKSHIFYKNIVARHQSVLRRTLGDSNPNLQENKITNLRQAILKINSAVIEPGQIFSLWQIIGQPKYKNGYVDGMFLANGQVVSGLGGGLCQLSNFLYWIFLHTPIETIERYHHSIDTFPDSGRTLPFGGGATILYNFIDLKVKNTSRYPLQIKIWLTDKYLKGQILAPYQVKNKFHVFEKNHYFVKKGKQYFRYNEIYREVMIKGKTIKIEKITTNFAPVLYKVTSKYLKDNNFKVLDFTGIEL